MLIAFSVENFLSINEQQSLSLLASKVRSNSNRIFSKGQNRLIKFLAIYGANASGKSNIVHALSFAQATITNGLPASSKNDYCRTREENRTRPSKFEFNIRIEEKEYTYGFRVILSTGTFVEEWLKETHGKTAKTIFSRDVEIGAYIVNTYFKGAELNSRLKIYAEDIRTDGSALFLRLMNQNKDNLYESFADLQIYKKIYNWFRYRLSVNYPDSPITSYSYLADRTYIDQISVLLSAFDTGVSRCKIVTVPVEKVMSDVPKDLFNHINEILHEKTSRTNQGKRANSSAIMLRAADNSMYFISLKNDEMLCETIEFEHKNINATFSLSEESDGTIRLLDLIEVLLCQDNGNVYIIDEINRRFHPLLTYKFVEEYLKLASDRDIQLIVTTHESRLMDFELLRNDEIGFVDKSELGESRYYSMASFGERFDKKIRSAYLKGKYGAIPKFENVPERTT